MNCDKTEIETPGVPELDLQMLMGFERVRAEQTDAGEAEDAVATAFNKRGEGPI
jgi:hypothetical protein